MKRFLVGTGVVFALVLMVMAIRQGMAWDWSRSAEACLWIHRSLEEMTDAPERGGQWLLGVSNPESAEPGGYRSPPGVRFLTALFAYGLCLGAVFLIFDEIGKGVGRNSLRRRSSDRGLPAVACEERVRWTERGMIGGGSVMAVSILGQFALTYGSRWTFSPRGIPVPLIGSDGQHFADGCPIDGYLQRCLQTGLWEPGLALTVGMLVVWCGWLALQEWYLIDLQVRRAYLVLLKTEVESLEEQGAVETACELDEIRMSQQRYLDEIDQQGWIRWLRGRPRS